MLGPAVLPRFQLSGLNANQMSYMRSAIFDSNLDWAASPFNNDVAYSEHRFGPVEAGGIEQNATSLGVR